MGAARASRLSVLPTRAVLRPLSKLLSLLTIFAAGALSAPGASANPIEVTQLAAFLNSPTLGAQSLEDTRVGFGFNELSAAGLGVSFLNGLDAQNLGTASWLISNGTGTDLRDVDLFVFLDAEIVEPGNSFFNESGALVDVSGTGAADSAADSWEIDEPGFLFGDIFGNLLAGVLDGTNAVPAGQEDDVSLALGFSLGDVLAEERILASIELSRSDIGGLSHTDPDLGLTFFFNGSARVLPASVAEPGPLALIAAALLLPWSTWAARRRRSRAATMSRRTAD